MLKCANKKAFQLNANFLLSVLHGEQISICPGVRGVQNRYSEVQVEQSLNITGRSRLGPYVDRGQVWALYREHPSVTDIHACEHNLPATSLTGSKYTDSHTILI